MFSKGRNFLAEQVEECGHNRQLKKRSKTTEFTKIYLEILMSHRKATPLFHVLFYLIQNKLDSDPWRLFLRTLPIITTEGVIITFSTSTHSPESKALRLTPLTIKIDSTLHILAISSQ